MKWQSAENVKKKKKNTCAENPRENRETSCFKAIYKNFAQPLPDQADPFAESFQNWWKTLIYEPIISINFNDNKPKVIHI